MTAPMQDTIPEHFQLKFEILAARIPQFVIAQRVGLSETALSRIISGRNPLPAGLADKIRAAIAEGPQT